MDDAALLLKIAILAAGAVGRDLAPPARSVVKTAAKKTAQAARHRRARWLDKKALNTPLPPFLPERKPEPATPAGPIVMYDAVDVAHIPAAPPAVAGYVNGLYVTVPELRARFPHARLLTIAVNIGADADCLDVETGDATPAQAPEWVRRQLGAGLKRPCVYASRSTMPAVWSALQAAGIKRDQVRLWAADWTGEAHIPASYDACQWRGGETAPYDESLALATFFD